MKQVLIGVLMLAAYFAIDKLAEVNAPKPVTHKAEEKGYTQKERDEMDKVVGFAIKQQEIHTYRKATLAQRQVEALKMVFHITPQNMNSDIFGR